MEVKEKTKRQVGRKLEEVHQQSSKIKEDTSYYRKNGWAQEQDSSQILVVDDASVDRELLKNILMNHGYQVSSASSGSMALKLVPVEMPDLILLDVKMPGMDGYEVCRLLKSDGHNPQIPIIFISSLNETEDIVRGFKAGGVDFISKPFKPAEVIARVETHLALWRLQRKLEVQNIQLQQEINDRMKVEEELHRSHDNLERLVAERTDELLINNRQLEAEIEERKKVEEYLRESERRLFDIIDFLPDATFAIDGKGKVIAWNRAIEEMTGTKTEDILGKGDYEYALPFYGVRRPILIDLVFSTDERVLKEYYFFRKEGDVLLAEGNASVKDEIRVLWAKASPLYDSSGNILGAIEAIRDITERRRSEKALKKREKELDVKTRNLEDLNTALKVLLKQREDDKNEIEKRTMSNVKELIIPYIEKLKKGSLDNKDMVYLNIVESNLNGILSPFSNRLSTKYMSFTPKELQIAHFITEGKTTKEIAELLNASPGTIDFHRNNIRNKLNLKNRRANLRSYLLTFS